MLSPITQWVVRERREPDFSWMCTEKEQESMDSSFQKGNSVRKITVTLRVVRN